MLRIEVQKKIFKNIDSETFARHTCPRCKLLLSEAVQPSCGHRICKSCADEILDTETTPHCPVCDEEFDNEDGAYVSIIIVNLCMLNVEVQKRL